MPEIEDGIRYEEEEEENKHDREPQSWSPHDRRLGSWVGGVTLVWCGRAAAVAQMSFLAFQGVEGRPVSREYLRYHGSDQYSYVGCGDSPGATYYALPKSLSATATDSQSSSASSTTALSAASSTLTTLDSTSSAPTSVAPVVPSSPTQTETANGSSLNIGAIVGGVLGATALICLTILGVVLIRKRPARKERDLNTAMHEQAMVNGDKPKQPFYTAALVEIYMAEPSRSPVELGVSSRATSFQT
ncbi:hypothetical protein P152DRAFT_473256 [Eremomyces bilateralis CBS 781.70]|uniref:Mid2 domain-containing protein n=1 Tax=Eremomyces bilateralis CBS 781.70 TaxID=1392243 RepID=A0A6G1G6N0_9PEZI|nr:uncharacterized protein P152DRAFT_473256 [Eremomyces bilateralis CBS 781.70]KAF1813540.1 hypothetical protein P152DRAFT_473256 [Eremomyces bilateralis CBS 781.70]